MGEYELIFPDNGYLIEGSGMRFPDPWRPGTGYVEDAPSGVMAAIWFVSGPGTDQFESVYFNEPVSSVRFFYSSIPDVTLEAFDANGNLLVSDTQLGNAVTGFNVWYPIGVDVGENIITKITIWGYAFQTAIDDITTCRFVTQALEDAIIYLIDDIGEIGLHKGIENSLVKKLENALKSLEKGNEGAAINKLNAFINEVEAQRGKKIDAGDAEALINKALGIIETILSPDEPPTPPDQPPPPGDGL
ncbi:hypothetical protein ACFLXH_06850 [Chloroflexota bacterium]